MLSDGKFWQQQQRFALPQLPDLGFGRTISQNIYQEEIHELLEDLSVIAVAHPEQIVNFRSIFAVSIINIFWAIIAGERFERGDAKFLVLLRTVEQFFRSGNAATANLPVPKCLLKKLPALNKLVRVSGALSATLQDFVKVKYLHR